MAVSSALSMSFAVVSRELFPPSPQHLTSSSWKRRESHFRVSAKLGGGEGDVKKEGKNKFITKEQEPEQHLVETKMVKDLNLNNLPEEKQVTCVSPACRKLVSMDFKCYTGGLDGTLPGLIDVPLCRKSTSAERRCQCKWIASPSKGKIVQEGKHILEKLSRVF
ncbi:hypothetical protein HAX54_039096 [Datura stramonium]|uniref:Uncharacterized protein n=1 Tax=Datura stramonium TaxID=4076 RepID=A0ABS8VKQ4_DATST|nr:hypothetical protein [Datura stramonium]